MPWSQMARYSVCTNIKIPIEKCDSRRPGGLVFLQYTNICLMIPFMYYSRGYQDKSEH